MRGVKQACHLALWHLLCQVLINNRCILSSNSLFFLAGLNGWVGRKPNWTHDKSHLEQNLTCYWLEGNHNSPANCSSCNGVTAEAEGVKLKRKYSKSRLNSFQKRTSPHSRKDHVPWKNMRAEKTLWHGVDQSSSSSCVRDGKRRKGQHTDHGSKIGKWYWMMQLPWGSLESCTVSRPCTEAPAAWKVNNWTLRADWSICSL